MKKLMAWVLAIALLMGLTACGNSSGLSKSTWVTYEEISNKVKNEENKDILVYSYQQPVISTQSDGAKIINTKLSNATSAFLYGSGGVEELTEMAKMDWREPWFTCYSLTRDVSVARIDDTVASFRYSDYAFTGGVHGYTSEYGVTYDMVSGEQLSLGNLTHDEWALKEVCRRYILEITESEDYIHKQGLFEGYESSLDTVLKNWVLTEEGLQFIAQPYVIAAYAAGTLHFTVPYERIAHVLDEKWVPEEHGHGGGTIQVDHVDSDMPGATNFLIDPDGMTMVLRVNGTIYDFSVEGVKSYWSNGEDVFYFTQQHLYSPQISSESVGLHVTVPDTVPTTMLRYTDGSGNEYQYYLVADGSGGVKLEEANPQIVRE